MAHDNTPRSLEVAAQNGAAQLLTRARLRRNAPGFWAGWFPGRVMVGSVDYWPDPAVSKPYPGWLGEIASQAAARRAWLSVVGHSSRTGSSEFNDRLSEQRASAVTGQLAAVQPALAGARLAPTGVGFRENLVGSGTDDARDAVDRRVEFRVVECR